MEQTPAQVFPFGLRPPVNAPQLDPELRDAVRSAALDDLRNGKPRSLLDAVMAEDGLFAGAPTPPAVAWDEYARWHVVIPVRGRHDLVERCLAGLVSLDDRADFDVMLAASHAERQALHRIASRFDAEIGIVTSSEPLGFAANCNLGFSRYPSRDSDRVLFLNSDTDPSPLGSIAGAFDSALRLADAAGPIGSNVSGFQTGFPLEPAAFGYNARATRAPLPRLVGFALAVNVGAFRAVGGWDESYGIGNFDDDDLSLRLALWSDKPHRLAFVPSAFVDHVGSASFAALPDAEKTYNDAMAVNRARFERRWGWCLPAINDWWRSGR